MSALSRRPVRWLALLAATSLALVGLIAAPANATAPTVTISPTTAAPGTITSFTVTVSGSASTSAAQDITITVPASFSSPSLDSWTKPDSSWTVSGPVGSTWKFSGPSNKKLNGTNTPLVAHFSAVTPAAPGSYTWTVGGTTNGSNTIDDFISPSVDIGVVKQNQTITFANPGTQTYGAGPLTLTATASSGLTVSYTTSGQCSVSGSSLSLDAAGSCTVTAHQAGNATYNAAPDVPRTFTIGKASQTITFDPIDTQTYGDGPRTLTATGGGSGNPVTFTSTGDCSVTGTSLSLDAAGTCTVTAHQAGNGNYQAADDVSRTFTINKAQAVLSLSDLSYTYNGHQHGATVTTDPAGLDTVTVTYDGSATEPTDAGSYAVHATLDNPNYEADAVDGTLVIDQKHVTGTFTVDNKDYDTYADATISGCSLTGTVSGDDVSLDCSSATAMFDGANAGPHTASIDGAVLAGNDAGNYVLDGVDDATGTINRLQITASLQAGDKTYDGSADASADATLSGVLGNDDVDVAVDSASFPDKNVGTDRTVTATVHLTGTDEGNYVLASTTITDTANITKLHITGAFTADNKVYDGTTDATVLTRSLVGVLSPGGVLDDASLSGGTAAFADENAGPGKTVTLTGATLSGADAGNYALDSVATTTANITKRSVTGSFTASDKLWDGNTDATIASRSLAAASGDTGKISGDDVSLGGGTATFADAFVGSEKTVTATGFTLGGTDAGNYSLVPGPWTTTASILALYRGTGFYQPVDMPTATNPIIWNTIKGGQTVPLKFEVFNTQTGVEQTALTIFGADGTAQAGAFSAKIVSCATGTSATEDAIEVTTTGGTSLRYDTTGGQFIQNWKTPTTVGTCYKVSVRTVDGSAVGPAYFKVTK